MSRKRLFAAGLGLWLMLAISAAGLGADLQPAKLVVEPSSLSLTTAEEGRRVLVTGVTADGETFDLTNEARFEPAGEAVRVADDGYLQGVSQGTTTLRISARGQSAELPVKVGAPSSERKVSFLRDVMPVLNKQGCTSGPCHGSAKGKNGFKLSLRGYDPKFDYRALLYDVSGRRFNRADPAQSLMLAKPAQDVPHEGGLRIEKDSRYYDTILKWISEGTPFGDEAKDSVAKLEVMPADVFMGRPGMKQQMLVVAHYGDGSVRDVTREAVVASSQETTAKIVNGSVVEGERIGEATLMVRYEGKFVIVPVTILNPAPGFEWKQLSQHNYIDEHIDAKLKRLKIQPSEVTDDGTFVRRVYLDLIGIPPTPEQARDFIEDPEKSRLKRIRLIDDLMKRTEFVDHWALKWGDLLQSNRKYLGEKGTWAFRQWIRDQIATNRPYDEVVRDLITSSGSTYQNPPANFFRVNKDPKEAMEKTTQLFLGVRMACAQCHDHPFERWTQNQYYQLAAFFASVGVKPGFDSDEEIVYLKRDDNTVKHPKTGKVVEAEYLIAGTGAPPLNAEDDRREALAAWLTSEKNPFFARAIPNRVWSYFFGRGIIDPVDDIRASNPPVNEALLQALADDFVKNGYDLQHVIRTIVNSRAYQTGIAANEWNAKDETNFSRFLPRRLTAESLLDAITVATGSRPEFEEVPQDFTAQQLPDPHVGKGGFLDMFGRPERESACECERRSEMSLPQAMSLVNGPTLAEAIADPEGRVAEAILGGKPDRELVEELYLAALSRLPTPGEMDKALTYLRQGTGRAAKAQDLLWALVNSNAFLFNR
ncbi:MAG TPA: DUF1549 and DUF1553 domain-containing protein [Bryobacterales bacterium]|nr:DUF1549 and DUF1553 domain-containing protein [Bryobacterales bacterium]